MKVIDRVIKISTIENAYMLEFHERTADNEQHHVRAYKTFEELEDDLKLMLSPVQMQQKSLLLN